MHAVVWTYRIAPGAAVAFEALYGAEGDWARLFRRAPGYLGTELYRDAADPARYLTIDRWRTRADYEAFLQSAYADYAALDARGDALTLEEARLAAVDA